ncbi:MAG: tRNA dihydrouridine(20/20a) synthase DusA [Halothiobacillaceae bacterium]
MYPGVPEPRPIAEARRLAVAPMLNWTDRHFRFLLRLISRDTLLYTEMVTTGALLHGDRGRHLDFGPREHPLVLQLGGSDPGQLARCAEAAAEWGYDEINLNVGCPSDRVQSGRFGACLMADAPLVGECVAAMASAVDLPVSVKCRIGIDQDEGYAPLGRFVAQVADAGCRLFTVHARKAWLQGLSPKENRDVPPLRHDLVHRLKADFPELHVTINGGIDSLEAARAQLEHVDGVMMGRAVYHDPWILAQADRLIFADDHPMPERLAVAQEFAGYIEECLQAEVPLHAMTRHVVNLFNGCPGARRYRRHLSEHATRRGVGVEVFLDALAAVA